MSEPKNPLSNPAALIAFLKGYPENFITASTPGGVEAQEAAGQQQLIRSEQMPRVDRCYPRGDSKEVLEKLGFKILGVADDQFYHTQFPSGWTREAADHSMHSYVLDERGRKRIHIFFKAAFYDYRAHLDLETRYKATYRPQVGWDDYDSSVSPHVFVAAALDGETEIWVSELISVKYVWDVRQLSVQWLDEHYPDWHNPFAYWE